MEQQPTANPENNKQNTNINQVDSFWYYGRNTLKAIWFQGGSLAIFGIAVPLFIFHLFFDLTCQTPINQMNSYIDSANYSKSGVDFLTLLTPTVQFLSTYFLCFAGICLIIASSYLGIIHITKGYHNKKEVISLKTGFLRGLRSMPKLLLAAIYAVIILVISQYLFFILSMVLSILALMVPVIIVSEKMGIIKSCNYGLSMGYTKHCRGFRLRSLFQFLTMGLLLYIALSVVFFLGDLFIHLDQFLGFKRDIWIHTFDGLPFGYIMVIKNALSILISSILFSLFAVFSTTYYLTIKGQPQ